MGEVRPQGARGWVSGPAQGAAVQTFTLESLGAATLTTASRSLGGDDVAAGTSDGRVLLAQIRFRSRYEGQRLVDQEIDWREKGVAEVDPEAPGAASLGVSANETDSGPVVAALLEDGDAVVWKGC